MLGLCKLMEDAAPTKLSGLFDMCQNALVNSLRPIDFCTGVANIFNAEPRNTDFIMLFMVINFVYL